MLPARARSAVAPALDRGARVAAPSWTVVALVACAVGCAAGPSSRPSAAPSGGVPSSGAAQSPDLVVVVDHSPLTPPDPLGRDAVVALTLVRQPLRNARGGPVSDDARFEHKREVVQHADLLYTAYVRATQAAAHTAQRASDVEQLRAAVEQLVNSGRATRSDLLRVVVAAAEQRIALARAEDALAQSRANLNAALGRPPDAPLAPPSDQGPAAVATSLDELTRMAERGHGARAGRPDPAALRGQVAVAHERLAHALREWQAVREMQAAVDAARAAFEAEFRAGRANMLQMLDLHQQLARAGWERIEASSRVSTASAELEWVVGERLARVDPGNTAPQATR